MKKDATQRATTEIANSWSAHSTINHVRSPDTSITTTDQLAR